MEKQIFVDDKGDYHTICDDLSHKAMQIWLRAGPWEACICDGCEAVHDECGVLGISGFALGKVLGDGVRDWPLVTGPTVRDVLAQISDVDLSLAWLITQNAIVTGKAAEFLRVSFAGKPGWEVHCMIDDAPVNWDAVTGAGAKPFGMYALDRLRLEKGYRAWKTDLSTDYTIYEAGLERFISAGKQNHDSGIVDSLNAAKTGAKKRFVTLNVEARDADAPYMSTIWQGGHVVGETTSGGWGYRIDGSIALGVVRADLAVEGTALEVEIYGERCKAVVQKDTPLWDPHNERIRA